MIAQTPDPPYVAVIFTSVRTKGDSGYKAMSSAMLDEVKNMEGFLGYESARDLLGITVSYWSDLESVKLWKNHREHLVAQSRGKTDWYSHYKVRICRVERDYEWFPKENRE